MAPTARNTLRRCGLKAGDERPGELGMQRPFKFYYYLSISYWINLM